MKLNKEIKSIYTEKKKSNKNKLIQEVIIYFCCIRMVSNSDHSDPSTFANAVKFIFNTRTDTTGRLIQNCEKWKYEQIPNGGHDGREAVFTNSYTVGKRPSLINFTPPQNQG